MAPDLYNVIIAYRLNNPISDFRMYYERSALESWKSRKQLRCNKDLLDITYNLYIRTYAGFLALQSKTGVGAIIMIIFWRLSLLGQAVYSLANLSLRKRFFVINTVFKKNIAGKQYITSMSLRRIKDITAANLENLYCAGSSLANCQLLPEAAIPQEFLFKEKVSSRSNIQAFIQTFNYLWTYPFLSAQYVRITESLCLHYLAYRCRFSRVPFKTDELYSCNSRALALASAKHAKDVEIIWNIVNDTEVGWRYSYLGDFKVKEYVNPAIMTSPTAEIISEPKQPAAFWEPRLIIHASDSYGASLLTPYELSCYWNIAEYIANKYNSCEEIIFTLHPSIQGIYSRIKFLAFRLNLEAAFALNRRMMPRLYKGQFMKELENPDAKTFLSITNSSVIEKCVLAKAPIVHLNLDEQRDAKKTNISKTGLYHYLTNLN